MAFRVGQDLGIQQDPRFLASQDYTISSEIDLFIRRRLYWGVYVADKLACHRVCSVATLMET